jgi:hypothetical protein
MTSSGREEMGRVAACLGSVIGMFGFQGGEFLISCRLVARIMSAVCASTQFSSKFKREWLSATIASLEVSTMFALMELLKYLAAVVVTLSILTFGLTALTF